MKANIWIKVMNSLCRWNNSHWLQKKDVYFDDISYEQMFNGRYVFLYRSDPTPWGPFVTWRISAIVPWLNLTQQWQKKTQRKEGADWRRINLTQGNILWIFIIPPPPLLRFFFSPTNKFAAGGAKFFMFIPQKDAFLRPFPPFLM